MSFEKDAEEFIRWYLRFNGYFTVESFVIHNGEVTTPDGTIKQRTECDLLAIRLPHSTEMAGPLHIVNHSELTAGADGKLDLVICEVKTGKDNDPNPVWINAKTNEKTIIGYILRFFGAISLDSQSEFDCACKELASNYVYSSAQVRVRYILFAKEANPRHIKRGVTYITYSSIVDFLIKRGNCWRENEMGKASQHKQWSQLVKDVFSVLNDEKMTDQEKHVAVSKMLHLN